MKAAIYARYSSENQRPESITDQVESCRKLAAARGYEISSEHVFSDEASSGARSDRSGHPDAPHSPAGAGVRLDYVHTSARRRCR